MNNTIKNLEYNIKDFSKAYSEHFVTAFNHGPMTKGPVNKDEVKKNVEVLNEKISEITKAINFREDLIEDQLNGGSCSSIAFRIASVALNYLREMNGNQNLTEKVKNSVDEINRFTSSKRKNVRNIQATFNTINISTVEKVEDICQEKIKALAVYFDIKVCHSSDEYLISETETCEKWFDETMDNLKNGVYLVRIIQKEDNHKLETQGHSTIYIKNEDEELYFDTQLGLYKMNGARDIIYRSICSAKKRFHIDSCKFHQLSI